jgi:hypothetical protein
VASAILAGVARSARGLGLLDAMVVLGLLALLVWLVRLDWPRAEHAAPAPPPEAARR